MRKSKYLQSAVIPEEVLKNYIYSHSGRVLSININRFNGALESSSTHHIFKR
ncbi:hypothetical protein FDUTEX481_08457 [Tolypothrix sp. PCC 7601]|nr:hypothetical protein FDUTEX481_08457 [Tolypothrix sp. PCC 7601]BAY94921.1 hypothetical protein NIES3275_69760 [Microchaete diplosiphon NIES-3275]